MRQAVGVVLLALVGCAAPAEPGVFQRRIVGGTPTTGDPAVMMIIAQHPGSQLATLCTATLVSPHVLLTAAHCVSPDLVGTDAEFSVYRGDNIDTAKAGDLLRVNEVHAHPDFSVSNVQNGADIAVAITRDELSPTIPMNRTPLSSDLIGQAARMVGYGKTSATDTTGATAGQKRVADTVMGTYTDKLVRFGEPGTTTCEGDSGGPGLMTIDGREVIVGVVSFGDQECAQLGVDTRVDVYADTWVAPYIEQVDPGASETGTSKRGGCAFAPSSPSGAGAALVLVAFLLLARSRELRKRRRFPSVAPSS